MKLELKHLVGYLPYGLHIKQNEGFVLIICGAFKKHNADDFFTYSLLNWERDVKSTEAKPILRPLSDIIKEEFNYLYTLLRVHLGKNKRDKLINEGYGITDLPYFIIEQLLENHFDVFLLIEQNLAIDINILNK